MPLFGGEGEGGPKNRLSRIIGVKKIIKLIYIGIIWGSLTSEKKKG